jgi:hypothetical protein
MCNLLCFPKGGGAVTLVPDTQELCRRLEEKIANLTRMGSNLQQENQGRVASLAYSTT